MFLCTIFLCCFVKKISKIICPIKKIFSCENSRLKSVSRFSITEERLGNIYDKGTLIASQQYFRTMLEHQQRNSARAVNTQRDSLQGNQLISRAVISGWLVRFGDFQRNHRFGSKIAERFVDFRKLKNAHFSSDVFSLLCFVDFQAPIPDYPPKALYTYKRNI